MSPARGEGVLEGVIERLVYTNQATGYCVARLRAAGHRGLVTVVGELGTPVAGEGLRLQGAWETHARYGRQFRAVSFVPRTPTTDAGLARLLAGGLVPGIGPGLAGRIVSCFGPDTLAVLDLHPERLREVPGLGSARAAAVARAWRERTGLRDLQLALRGAGIGAALCARIYRRYGRRGLAVARGEPYRLAAEVRGIGFATADRLARGLGLDPLAPARLEAGVRHTLEQASAAGHVCCPRTVLVERAAGLLAVPRPQVERALGALVRRGELVAESSTVEQALYLPSLHAAECRLARRLLALTAVPPPAAPAPELIARRRADFERERCLTLATQQRRALDLAARHAVLIVTGGPGTGKTTLVRALVAVLAGRRLALCAPTGRAARRLAEATGRPASTIHRLLEYLPREGRFLRHERRPLAAELTIVDELSMVDLPLLDSLVAALPPGGQLILVGDADQLPSVGAGSALRDLIASAALETVVLDQIFRQAFASQIVRAATAVRAGRLPDLARASGEDLCFVERAEPEQVLAAVKELVADRIPRRLGLDPRDGIQVLTPMHRGPLGTRRLNAELQGLLNPGAPALVVGGREFRVGDKVMQVSNDHELEIYNGDIGQVVAVDADRQRLVAAFDGVEVLYDREERDNLDLLVPAYACTIHKAQGSEYPAVVIVLHDSHYVMLQRSLLYTALTRARRLAVLVGTRRALAIAVGNRRVERRHSLLGERLAALAHPAWDEARGGWSPLSEVA